MSYRKMQQVLKYCRNHGYETVPPLNSKKEVLQKILESIELYISLMPGLKTYEEIRQMGCVIQSRNEMIAA